MAGTKIGQSIVSTNWLHICHVALTPKIACCCQIHLEWFWFRTVNNMKQFSLVTYSTFKS